MSNKYLTEPERLEFLAFLEKNKLSKRKTLTKKLYVNEDTISINLTKFPRKVKEIKTPRIWKDLIEKEVENQNLKCDLKKAKIISNQTIDIIQDVLRQWHQEIKDDVL
ncbi:MAG: hypothetical protein ULS35scaffold63_3 [Phage 33_17]|nr:MAG: hypothetical protein ULS35scaffold63_3 [Phage 33_17]